MEEPLNGNSEVNSSLIERNDVFSSSIGIIFPPPEVKAIVDKTALFVSKNGLEFEERIRSNEANNLKFNFMNPNDPYYGYYQYKLKESVEKILNPNATATTSENLPTIPATFNAPIESVNVGMTNEKFETSTEKGMLPPGSVNYYEKMMNEVTPNYQKIIEVPKYTDEEIQNITIPKSYEFLINHPNILLMDIDIMKVTAQFVAKGGRLFLNNLMQREQRNYFFDFLKPQHSLYTYFLSLVDQYTKIINPSPKMLDEIKETIDNNQASLIKNLQIRCFFEKQRLDQKQEQDEANEKDRIAFAQIDWHDFIVVEQVSFKDETDRTLLPHPVSLEKLGERLLAQERYEAMQREKNEKTPSNVEVDVPNNLSTEVDLPSTDNVVNMNSNISIEDSEQPTIPVDSTILSQNKTTESSMDDMSDTLKATKRRFEALDTTTTAFKKAGLISKDSTSVNKNKDNLMISPITGELIPAESIAEHMKVNLLDPRYKEQKERLYLEKKQQDEVFTVGSSMVSHLKELAQRRSDIFGPSTQETQIGKKLEEYQPVNSSKSAVPTVTNSTSISNKTDHVMLSSNSVSSSNNQQIKMSNTSTTTSISHHNINIAPPKVPTSANATLGTNPPQLNTSVITKIPEGLSQPPKFLPMHSTGHFIPTSQTPIFNTHNTPVGLPPPIFNPMNNRMPIPSMMASNPPHLRAMPPMTPLMPVNQPPYGVGVHGLPPPSLTTAPSDPFTKQTNPIESMLIPEAVFLSSNSKHEITLKIKMPENEDLKKKHGWKLEGQFESIPSNMTWKISQLKAEITKAIGIPTSKQKLTIGQGFFMKDANTLAYYNLTDSSFVNLQIKERGGKNK